jgi:uncharacterized protein YbjT (DUF2867 family)
MVTQQTITVFGANGFIGSEIVRVLAKQGYRLKLAHQHPRACDYLKVNGSVGQIVPIACDFSDQSIQNIIQGSYAVVNCTGILTESGKRTFTKTHCDLPETIAKACKKNGVNHLVHISALGIELSKSKYAASKLAGEKTVQKVFKNVTILRPSIVFGPNDSFFNMFHKMSKLLPALPLIGGGKTKFQPVYVGDVAQAVSKSIQKRSFGIFEIGGPDIASFKSLLEKMKHYTQSDVTLVPVPLALATVQGAVLQNLPGQLLTIDQVRSLKTDNIVQDNALKLADLGITPQSMDTILPTYLGS